MILQSGSSFNLGSFSLLGLERCVFINSQSNRADPRNHLNPQRQSLLSKLCSSAFVKCFILLAFSTFPWIIFNSGDQQLIPWWCACKALLATVEPELWKLRPLASAWISPLCQTQHKVNWPWQWVELPPIWTPKPTIRAAWFITDLSICDRSAPLLLITHTFSVNLSYSPRLYLSAEGSNLLTYNVIM